MYQSSSACNAPGKTKTFRDGNRNKTQKKKKIEMKIFFFVTLSRLVANEMKKLFGISLDKRGRGGGVKIPRIRLSKKKKMISAVINNGSGRGRKKGKNVILEIRSKSSLIVGSCLIS